MVARANPRWLAGRLRLAVLAALAVFLAVSLVYTQVIATSDRHAVAWRDLTAELGAVSFPRQVTRVIRSQEQLVSVLEEQMPGNAPVPPPIDFSRREALLAAVGPRSSTGYDLRVVSVTEQRDRIVVRLRERTPGLRDRVAARLTFPYRLITIPASSKPVRFRLEDRP